MKTLYLLRHAKAEPGGKDISDPDRVLAPRGHEACATIGAYMQEKRYQPALVLSSPSARTRETSALIAQAAGIKAPQQFQAPLYLASAEQIIHAVQKLEDNLSSVLVVGHNPGMHHAALTLSGRTENRLRTELELKYPTCALTVLQFAISDWAEIKPSGGELIDFITPGEL